ncbi:PSP1 C-terminal conserved region-domain-containing protein [Chlamydoabsidia padenii]|nr:PSP1 C-terminal conserved region-domain-containing protein [Chlamydoabsidia padenii]
MEEEECNLLPFKLLDSGEGHEQQQQQQQQQLGQLPYDQPLSWCLVEFKAGRAEIYYSTSPVHQDDWVIVEADRGRDLGKVVAKDLPLDQVHLLLAATNNATNTTPTLTAGADNASLLVFDHPPSPSSSTSSSSSSSSLPLPKQICRLATPSEITLLVTKRHDEQKALLICQTKSKQKNLLMDIVDAEYQWDRRKLTFYFIAERRVDFRELVRDLFKLYKTRIWM